MDDLPFETVRSALHEGPGFALCGTDRPAVFEFGEKIQALSLLMSLWVGLLTEVWAPIFATKSPLLRGMYQTPITSYPPTASNPSQCPLIVKLTPAPHGPAPARPSSSIASASPSPAGIQAALTLHSLGHSGPLPGTGSLHKLFPQSGILLAELTLITLHAIASSEKPGLTTPPPSPGQVPCHPHLPKVISCYCPLPRWAGSSWGQAPWCVLSPGLGGTGGRVSCSDAPL